MSRVVSSRVTLLILLFVISAVFLCMIRQFLMATLLAAILSAVAHPGYRRLVKLYRGRDTLAAVTVLLLVLGLVLLPLGGLLGIVAAQALKVGQSVTPWVQHQLSEPAEFSKFLSGLPFYDQIEPYRDLIFKKAGELVSGAGNFLLEGLSSVTRLTVNFLFMSFVLLYATFFFLMDGEQALQKILYYLPLEDDSERRMLHRFTSVARATLKGTAVIGVLQGGMSGVAFAVVGIDSAVFWGTIMAVLSIIPGVGTGLIWLPAGIILLVSGHYIKGIGLILFCGLVVGSVDNVLRPRLVGRDTEMHDLMIFFSTLGGIAMFGILGFILGPIIAALFVTAWEIYGEVFKDYLPEVKSVSPR